MLDLATLKRLWPNAKPGVAADVVASAPAVFKKYNLNTPLRVAHFMAQISHESGGGSVREENLNYTSPVRIAQVWPSRFTPESAKAFVRKPRELANKVYNGRMGNRAGSDDGWTYRGRGLLQITGRENYQKIGKRIGLDLEKNPGLALAPDKMLAIAADEFVHSNCLSPADEDDIRTVTKRINGGYIGIDDRRAWLAKWKLAIPELPGELPKTQAELEELEKPLPRQAEGDPTTTPADKITERATVGASVLAPIIAALTDWRIAVAVGGVVIVGLVVFFVLKRKGYFE
jgi:putative chitinase